MPDADRLLRGPMTAAVLGLVVTSTAARAADPPPDPRALLRAAERVLDAATGPAPARVRAGSQIADGYARLGDAAAARARLDWCLTTAARQTPRDYYDVVQPAGVYARLGDAATVRWLIAAVPPEADPHGRAREAIARHAAATAADAGHPAAADRIADAAPTAAARDHLRRRNRAWAAVRHARRGDVTAAFDAVAGLPVESRVAALVGHPPSDSPLIPHDPGPSDVPNVAGTLAAAGDRAGARAVVARVAAGRHPDNPDGDFALSAAGCAAARLGDRVAARQLLARWTPNPNSTRSVSLRLAAVESLAAAAAAAGDDAEVERLAVGLTAGQAAAMRLTAGLAAVRAGRRAAGLAAIDRIEREHPPVTAPARSRMALARALAGDLDGAGRVGGGDFHNWVTVARVFAGWGELEAARAVCRTRIPDELWRGVAESWVAARQARTGRAADARRAADAEADPLRRAFQLAGLVAGLVGDPD